ncbi:hypothetical protein QBC35DRAFT_415702 [Podospora australis]|uniref:Uncharacterized protein n=1 Tax=Podospora australis TaxID=1536484 RepID=A0AAN6WPG0_9PEZI|nr:hypothetical protein QBC35DRAFT_415702 [Podospora australis]
MTWAHLSVHDSFPFFSRREELTSFLPTRYPASSFYSSMNSQFLTVPEHSHGRHRDLYLLPSHTVESEIPSRWISVNDLYSMLSSRFPGGAYEVEISQNIYKIRAPSTIGVDDVIRHGTG